MDFKIEQCTKNNYQEFLTVINKAFGHEAQEEWFEKNIPHCTPYLKDATEDEIIKNYAAKLNGKIVGAAGIYPADWIVSDENGDIFQIKAFGVGQVCCLSEYRNRGVMTALMKETSAAMERQGYEVSFLGGDRFRYGHFGYEFGGNVVRYNIRRSRFEKYKNASLVNFREATLNDIYKLNTLYETMPSYIKRDDQKWKRHIGRYNLKFYIAPDGETGSEAGYICIKNGNSCIEAAGDAKTVLSLIFSYIQEMGLDGIIVKWPLNAQTNDEIGKALYNSASGLDICPYGMIALHNYNSLEEKLKSAVGRRFGGNFNRTVSIDTKEIIRGMFGFTGNPQTAGNKPLCAFIPEADNI